jgi:hypothetical protein
MAKTQIQLTQIFTTALVTTLTLAFAGASSSHAAEKSPTTENTSVINEQKSGLGDAQKAICESSLLTLKNEIADSTSKLNRDRETSLLLLRATQSLLKSKLSRNFCALTADERSQTMKFYRNTPDSISLKSILKFHLESERSQHTSPETFDESSNERYVDGDDLIIANLSSHSDGGLHTLHLDLNPKTGNSEIRVENLKLDLCDQTAVEAVAAKIQKISKQTALDSNQLTEIESRIPNFCKTYLKNRPTATGNEDLTSDESTSPIQSISAKKNLTTDENDNLEHAVGNRMRADRGTIGRALR